MISIYLFLPVILIALGIAAIKLPRKYNPFQLKRTYARHVSESTQNTIPIVVGWIMIGLGALGLVGILGLLLLSKFADSRHDTSSVDFAAENVRRERETVEKLNQAIQSADSYALLSKKGNRFIDAAKGQTSALPELKKIIQISPRENLGSALFIVPTIIINFDKNGKTLAQIQLSISKQEGAYFAKNAVTKENTEGTLGQEATTALLKILSQHKEENLSQRLDSLANPQKAPPRH